MVVDVERVKAQVDIVEIVGRVVQLKRAGRAYVGCCPFHEDKSPSFAVYADTQSYHCFGCEAHGDVLAFVQAYHGLDFKGAVEMLGGNSTPTPNPSPATQGRGIKKRDMSKPPESSWQEAAWQVVEHGERVLWSDAGAKARAYLTESRGLTDDIIRDMRLGYIPGHHKGWTTIAGLKIPNGVLIPWLIECQLSKGTTPTPSPSQKHGQRHSSAPTPQGMVQDIWQLKVRRAAGEPKYQQVAGGKTGGLYGIDGVSNLDSVVIVEGEFDAMVINQAGRFVKAVALGSANNRLDDRWISTLFFVPKIWAVFDNDRAGDQFSARLAAISQRIQRKFPPEGFKDANELWLADKNTFIEWLKDME